MHNTHYIVEFVKLLCDKISIFSSKVLIFLSFSYVMLFLKKEDFMQIKSRIHDKVLYVLLCGELDEHSAYYTRITLDDIFDKPDFEKIVVDLSELSFMDSTGIGVLIGRYKRMKEREIPIFIANPSSHAEKIFKMTGLYELIPKIV